MAMRKSLTVAVLAAGVLYLPQAGAHHALEYIDVSSYTITEQGQFIVYGLYDNMVDDPNDPSQNHWEFTPGISYGVTDWLMVDFHTHYAKFGSGHLSDEGLERLGGDESPAATLGPSPFLEAGTIALQVALPPNRFVNVGFGAAVEFPFKGAKRYLGAEDNVYEFELILDRELGEHQRITANILHVREGDEDWEEWRVGIRTPISPNPEGIAAGIEFTGNFEDSQWFMMPGIYAPLQRNIIGKMGLELSKEFEASRFHASLMYIF